MIVDSGAREEFNTGAVRDIQEGKGMCDLMPLDIVNDFLTNSLESRMMPLQYLDRFQRDDNYVDLLNAVNSFVLLEDAFDNKETAILEYSIHLEEGCKKYGNRNWQKGIPVRNYINSAVRHYIKYHRGDKDERHDRAFVWNCLCGAWTSKHFKELDEYWATPMRKYYEKKLESIGE